MSVHASIERHAAGAAAKSRTGPGALARCPDCPVRPLSICAALDCQERMELERIARQMRILPRAMLLMQDMRSDAVFNVTAGLLRLYRLSPGGQRQIVGFAFPGDFLGLPADERYGFSAEAVIATTVCRFPRRAFLAFADRHGRFSQALHDAAARTITLAHDQMMQLSQRRADAKIAAFLLAMRTRWARVQGASFTVPLPMGRQDIGDYLGLSIATVSRTLHRLAREGLIHIVPKGVHIFDPQHLKQRAAG